MPTGRRIYEEVWAQAQSALKKNSKYFDLGKSKHLFWWT